MITTAKYASCLCFSDSTAREFLNTISLCWFGLEHNTVATSHSCSQQHQMILWNKFMNRGISCFSKSPAISVIFFQLMSKEASVIQLISHGWLVLYTEKKILQWSNHFPILLTDPVLSYMGDILGTGMTCCDMVHCDLLAQLSLTFTPINSIS